MVRSEGVIGSVKMVQPISSHYSLFRLAAGWTKKRALHRAFFAQSCNFVDVGSNRKHQ